MATPVANKCWQCDKLPADCQCHRCPLCNEDLSKKMCKCCEEDFIAAFSSKASIKEDVKASIKKDVKASCPQCNAGPEHIKRNEHGMLGYRSFRYLHCTKCTYVEGVPNCPNCNVLCINCQCGKCPHCSEPVEDCECDPSDYAPDTDYHNCGAAYYDGPLISHEHAEMLDRQMMRENGIRDEH